jgi:hypothetical protein
MAGAFLRKKMRSSLRLPMAVVPLLLVSPARARDQLSLDWNAPEECPSSAAVEDEIRGSLSHVKASAPVRVHGEVTKAEENFSLRVRVEHEGELSERVLSVKDCREVARATALFVALAIEYRVKPTPPTPPAPPPPLPEPTQHWSATLGMHLSGGFAPNPTPGLGVSLAYARAPLRFVVRGAAFLPTKSTLEDNNSVGGEFSLLGAGVALCAGEDLAAAELWACGGGRLYHLSAVGFGTDTNVEQSTFVGAPMLGFDLGLHLTPSFLLVTGFEGGFAPASSRFVIESAGPVHETGHWFLEARLEIGARF